MSVLRTAGENAVMDGTPYKRKDHRRNKSMLSQKIMEAREEVINTQSIAQIHKQYLFALSLLKKEANYREGMVLLTDILNNLVKMNEDNKNQDCLELLYIVN